MKEFQKELAALGGESDELFDKLTVLCAGEKLPVVIQAALELISEGVTRVETKENQRRVITALRCELLDLEAELECDIIIDPSLH